jgi:hypothetical protein
MRKYLPEPIYISPAHHSIDDYYLRCVINTVKEAVVPHPNSVPLSTSEFLGTSWPGVISQMSNSLVDPLLSLDREFTDLPMSGVANV